MWQMIYIWHLQPTLLRIVLHRMESVRLELHADTGIEFCNQEAHQMGTFSISWGQACLGLNTQATIATCLFASENSPLHEAKGLLAEAQ
jgi:hypothetical protein